MRGVVQGHAWPALGVSWLAVFAIGSVQLLFTRLLGPMAILVGMFLLMVLGVPASNMGMSVFAMPGLYSHLHSFLPTPALGEALRSVMYFDGAGAAAHPVVLAIGALLGLALVWLIDAARLRKNPKPAPAVVNVASLHGGSRPKTRRWRYAALLFFPLAMVTMMVSFMLGAMSEPAPRTCPPPSSEPPPNRPGTRRTCWMGR